MAVQEASPSAAGHPVSTKPERSKVPTVLQQAQVECGAASLGMVLAHYGRWDTLENLRSACGVSRDGATAVGIVNAAGLYGLDFEAHRGTAQDMDGLSVPAILWWRRSHFVVLEGAHGGKFFINDPARGRYNVDADEFAANYSGVAITFTPNADFKKGGHAYRATPALWKRLKNSKSGVYFAMFAGILAMLLGLILAPISQLFINGVLGQGVESLLTTLAVVLLIIGLIRAGLNLLEYSVIARLQAKLSLVGSAGFLDRLLRLPLMFYMERSIGDLSQRVGYNSNVAALLATQMASAGISLLAAIGYAALLIYYNWIIGIVVLVLSALNVVVLRIVMDKRTATQSRVIRRQNQLRGTTTSSIQGIETIKSTGMEDDVFKTLTGQQADYISATASLVPSSALLVAVPVLLFALTNAAILVLGGQIGRARV